jgi:hypothetical protein
MKVTFRVRAARLRRLLDQQLIPAGALRRKVAKLVEGKDVTLSITEMSDLRVASRHRAKPLLSGAKYLGRAVQAAAFLLVA